MKLELKHLAGYLPYGLKIYDGEYQRFITFSHSTYSTVDIGIGRLFRPNYDFSMGLPVLYPLSDYSEILEIVEEMNDYEIGMIEDNPDMVKRLSYEIIELMFKNHIDIHGLIGSGLAIDINTLK